MIPIGGWPTATAVRACRVWPLVDVGGLVASTILALLMLPIYYEVMSPKRKPEPHYD